MNPELSKLLFAAILFCAPAGSHVCAQPNDEAAIRQVIQTLQDGWNQKDGARFASPFAEEHDYVVINGMFLPKWAREANARQHQQLFDGIYKEVDIQLRVSKIRSLSPHLIVAHIQGHSHPKGKPADHLSDVIMTMVLERGASGWKIVAFHNSPVQQQSGTPSDK